MLDGEDPIDRLSDRGLRGLAFQSRSDDLGFDAAETANGVALARGAAWATLSFAPSCVSRWPFANWALT